MFIDSHCHLDRIDLRPYLYDFNAFVLDARAKQLEHMLCISIDLESYPEMLELVKPYADISLSVGVHPNVTEGREPTIDDLLELAAHDKVIAIGETGLDYFHSKGDLGWQHQRFRNHISVAKTLNKPLIIHTRESGVMTHLMF